MKANLLLIVAILILAFSACNKISEDIQRDLIISPDSIKFSIPPMTVNGDSIVIDNLPTTLVINNFLDSLNRQGGEIYSVNNISEIRLSNFTVDLIPNKNDTVNNRSNFSSIGLINANLSSGTQKDKLAEITNNSSLDSFSAKLTLKQVMSNDLLRNYLNNGNLKYSLVIKPRKSTIDTIKAKIGTSYTMTLKK
ncbi:hypothetical protein [Pedobacter gandavensis]|uniref:hypothetical protein n=1 Tax=Pedobacter gandavensis TaxID=2679963 RepID=UPI00292E7AD1|nr:hypothetical protein [Pedobacter gandavensis]